MKPPYTWRDVERLLSRVKDPPWDGISADNRTLVIHCSLEARAKSIARLRDVWGARVGEERGEPYLDLVAVPGAPRRLQVVFDEDAALRRSSRPARPLWAESGRTLAAAPAFPAGAPKLAAFCSFKGGVGRTTVLLATLGALLERKAPAKVLVVDADIEAPGLTVQVPGSSDRFTLLDYLALVHDSEDWRREAVPIASKELSGPLSFELPVGRREVHFLPAFNIEDLPEDPASPFDNDSLFSHDVLPEHLVRTPGRAFVVADALVALGEALGVDVVLVDLRAGVSELASPLMLDPRVHRVLVSTCAKQSIEGTRHVLRRLSARADGWGLEVVLTMIPKDYEVAEKVGVLLRELVPEDLDDAARDFATPNVHEVPFAQELHDFDSMEELLSEKLPGTSLGKKTGPEIAAFLAPERPIVSSMQSSGLAAVAEVARRLEYAEKNVELRLLPTPALTALVEAARDTLPAAVVLGAKGAGKTYAWGQMVIAGKWSKFVQEVSPGKSGLEASIFPLLSPVNVDPALSERIQLAERAVRDALGAVSRETMSEAELRSDMVDAETNGDGIRFWSTRIARRLGVEATELRAIIEQLRIKNTAICLVVDGLEDAFQTAPAEQMSDPQRRRLRALLQDFTNAVRDLRSPYLGIVTFVRRDLAQAAIPQNFGQFEALYTRFALSWAQTEALRLVGWILAQANVLHIEQLSQAPYERLRDELAAFWNRRMGSDKSREAYTDLWVIAALSDYQGRLQARDLVRLVANAASKSAERGSEKLTAASLRDALLECSRKKIEELTTETRGLKNILDKLQGGKPEEKKMPFRAESFRLSPEEVDFLETHGIVARGEQGELFLPEIIRHGLSFKLEGGRRPAVLKMHRRSQRRGR